MPSTSEWNYGSGIEAQDRERGHCDTANGLALRSPVHFFVENPRPPAYCRGAFFNRGEVMHTALVCRGRAIGAALVLAAVMTTADAHHSRAAFQLDKLSVMKVTVTRVRWSNPHVFYAGTVVNEKGVAEEWIFEGHSISGLARAGWSEDTLEVGDRVDVYVNRHRDSTKHFALLDHVVMADGKTYWSVGQPPAGAVAKRPPIEPSQDFSGNWRFRFPGTPEQVRERVLLGQAGPDASRPYTALGKAQVAKYDADQNPALTCEPISMPAILMTVYEYKWIRHPDRIVIEKEQYNDSTRTIWLKSTARPPGYEPNPMGFSVGRFEADGTLVVETTGFSAVRWGNGQGIDSSEKKQIVERYRLLDGGMGLSLSYTLEDPVYYTAPVSGAGTFTKSYDSEFAKNPPCDLEAARQHLKFD